MLIGCVLPVMASLGSELPGGELFGSSVAAVGDADGDGCADFAVSLGTLSAHGTPTECTHASVAILSGVDGHRIATGAFGLHVERFSQHSLVEFGDVDADGSPDLGFVGWRWVVPVEGSRAKWGWVVAILSGKDAGTLRSWSFDGRRRGVSITNVPDMDVDGAPEIAVAVGCRASEDRFGSVWIRSGKSGQLLQQFDGTSTARISGDEITTAGDFDRDGRADLAISVEGRDDFVDGRIEVRSSLTGERLLRIAEEGGLRGGTFATVGDIDGDRMDELAVGAVPHGAYGHYDVRIHSGADGRVLRTIPGLLDEAKSGDVVATGDCDGDGTPDVLVSEYAPFSWGIARLVSGRDGSTLMQSDSAPYSENDWTEELGYSIAHIGDTDGDGTGDVVLGCCNPWSDQTGWVQLCSGRSGLVRFAVDQRVIDESK